MHRERSNYPKFQIHEKTLSTSEVVCRSGKLSDTRKRDQSLFSLLLEIESRLRTEDRNNPIEQLKQQQVHRFPRLFETTPARSSGPSFSIASWIFSSPDLSAGCNPSPVNKRSKLGLCRS